jgi:hypothetical protein
MATNRKPKGNYTRQTGDWFIDRAATVGGYFWPSSNLATVLDLYNNASDGTNLHVYRVFAGNGAAANYGMTRLSGHGAKFLTNAFPVVITGPTLPGQLYYDTIAPQFVGAIGPQDEPFFDALFMENDAGSMDVWDAPGPICLIPPGFFMRVYGFTGTGRTGGGAQMSASFYYVALPDRG